MRGFNPNQEASTAPGKPKVPVGDIELPHIMSVYNEVPPRPIGRSVLDEPFEERRRAERLSFVSSSFTPHEARGRRHRCCRRYH